MKRWLLPTKEKAKTAAEKPTDRPAEESIEAQLEEPSLVKEEPAKFIRGIPISKWTKPPPNPESIERNSRSMDSHAP